MIFFMRHSPISPHAKCSIFTVRAHLCDQAFWQTYEDGEKKITGCDVNQYVAYCIFIKNFNELGEHRLQYENHEIQGFVLNQIRSTNC